MLPAVRVLLLVTLAGARIWPNMAAISRQVRNSAMEVHFHQLILRFLGALACGLALLLGGLLALEVVWLNWS